MRCATEVKISSLTRFTVASCTRCKVLGKSDELTAAFDLPRDVRSQAKSQRHRSGPELLGEPLLSGIVKGFGCRPVRDGSDAAVGRRSKASRGGNRGTMRLR